MTDDLLRPVDNPELTEIARLLTADTPYQIMRVAGKLGFEASEVLAEVANAVTALETGGSNTAGLAVWRQGGTPTAAECTTFATANMISDVPNVNAGMKICFRADQGRSGLLSVQPGTSANELIAIATVWDH